MSILANKIFYINSEDRLSGTASNFTYELDIPEGARMDSCCVLAMTIPRSYYLVREGYNTFTLSLNGIERPITVPSGNYTAMSFIPILTSLLSDGTHLFTITFSSAVGKYTYSYTGPASSITFIFGNGRVGHQMGFDEPSENSFVANILASKNVLDFISTSSLFLHSNIVEDSSSVLQEIYSDNSVPFSNLVYNCQFPAMYSKKLKNDTSTLFQFSLTDERNRILDLNGHDILITLLLYRKENLTNLFKTVLLKDQ